MSQNKNQTKKKKRKKKRWNCGDCINCKKSYRRKILIRSISAGKIATLAANQPLQLCFLNPSPHRKEGFYEENCFSRSPRLGFSSLAPPPSPTAQDATGILAPRPPSQPRPELTPRSWPGCGAALPTAAGHGRPRSRSGSDTARDRGASCQAPRQPRARRGEAGQERDPSPSPPGAGKPLRGRARREAGGGERRGATARYSPTRSETSPKFRRRCRRQRECPPPGGRRYHGSASASGRRGRPQLLGRQRPAKNAKESGGATG